MKKTKQKEQKYKNTNKMSDVRIMNKIILQIYNTLHILWSSKVKFVSVVGMPLLWVQLWSFHSSRFYCLLWEFKKKKKEEEGRKDIKGQKEGIEQERRKERKKLLKGKK